MRYVSGSSTALLSASDTPQLTAIDNTGRIAWSSFHLLEVWQNGQTTQLGDGHLPGLNDVGDIGYSFKTPTTPWQLFVLHNGQEYRISNDEDIENSIDNFRPDINNAGEIAWWWIPNGELSPAGTRMMRRIRNGDVDFDNDVDIDDFTPMPGCFTGPGDFDRLCECRFFDIDHDRDIDQDDFDLFLRVYTGPQEDCDGNSILDLQDLVDGTHSDCNANGVPDLCDLGISNGEFRMANGESRMANAGSEPRPPALYAKRQGSGSGGIASSDLDGDGVPDECCVGVSAPFLADSEGVKNRFLSLKLGDPRTIAPTNPLPPAPFKAIRVRYVPSGGGSGWTMFVGPPKEVCENSGQGFTISPANCVNVVGMPKTFRVATLQCQPYYTNWNEADSFYVYHPAVAPGRTYLVQTINEGCGLSAEANFSAPLSINTPRYGDVVSNCSSSPCGPPNGLVEIQDIVALIDKFRNAANAPRKTRCDLEPAALDGVINITDAVLTLDAFRGKLYPFSVPSNPCP